MRSVDETLSFEDAMYELETVVQKLEGDGLALADSVALYERGRSLAQHCQVLLDQVALRVEQVQTDEEGGMHVVPLQFSAPDGNTVLET